MDTNINNLNLQRTFGKPILKTGKPTVYPHSIIATRKEIRGSEPSVIRTLRADEWEALREGAKAKEATVPPTCRCKNVMRLKYDNLYRCGVCGREERV